MNDKETPDPNEPIPMTPAFNDYHKFQLEKIIPQLSDKIKGLEIAQAKMAKRLNQEIIIILLLLGYLFFFKG